MRDNHCIDLVLTNDLLLISNVNVSAPFSTSDHCMVNFELHMSEHRAEESASQTELFYDYDNADVQSMIEVLRSHPINNDMWNSESFDNICFTDSANDVWQKFLSPINNVLNLESLEVRRVKIDLVTCFKILKGLTRITPSEFFTLSCAHKRTFFEIILPRFQN